MDGNNSPFMPDPQARAYAFVEHLRYALMPQDGIHQLSILLTLAANFAGKELPDGAAALTDTVELLSDYPVSALKRLPRIVTKTYSQVDLERFNASHREADQGRLGAVCQALLNDMRIVAAIMARTIGREPADAMLLRYIVQAGLRSVPAGMFLKSAPLAARAGQVGPNTVVVVVPKTVIRGHAEASRTASEAGPAAPLAGSRACPTALSLSTASPALVATIGRISRPAFFVDFAEQVAGFWEDISGDIPSAAALDNLITSAATHLVCRMTVSRDKLGDMLVDRLAVSLIESVLGSPMNAARERLAVGELSDTPKLFAEKVSNLAAIMGSFVKRSVQAHTAAGGVADFEMVADLFDLTLAYLLPVKLGSHLERIRRILRLGGQIVPHPLGSGRVVLIAGDRLMIQATA